MASRSEEVLTALFIVLSRLRATVKRNEGLITAIDGIDSLGLIVLQDGEPGQPEYTLSPMLWHYEHAAEVEIFVQGENLECRFDDLKIAIGAAIKADRTLGGAVDWCEPMAAKHEPLPELGAAPIKAATIIVMLHYAASDPLT